MRDDHFEWDDAKANRNLKVHEVSFELARSAFADPLGLDEIDLREDYGEERYARLGFAEGRLLFVAYTYRDGRIRIISARGAERYEHRRYHEALDRSL